MLVISHIIKGLSRSFLSFFNDWYVVYPISYWKKVIRFAKDMDKTMAFSAMVGSWFSPLYQDYDIVGFLIGIVIRTLWIVFDSIFYFFYFIFVTIAFIAWLLILPGIIFMMFFNL
jgi:hypothetical protein